MYVSIRFRETTPPQNRQLIGPLLNKISSRRFCGGVDFLKLLNKYILSNKNLFALLLARTQVVELEV